jgi:hypothetical protein
MYVRPQPFFAPLRLDIFWQEKMVKHADTSGPIQFVGEKDGWLVFDTSGFFAAVPIVWAKPTTDLHYKDFVVKDSGRTQVLSLLGRQYEVRDVSIAAEGRELFRLLHSKEHGVVAFTMAGNEPPEPPPFYLLTSRCGLFAPPTCDKRKPGK